VDINHSGQWVFLRARSRAKAENQKQGEHPERGEH
jgi:hypothetical protein